MSTLRTPPIAHTTLGAVQGRWVGGAPGVQVAEYLGLQYASAERWRPPIDRTDPYTEEPFVATNSGPNCPQWAGQVYNVTDIAEECLYMSCWSPPPSAQPAPVLVWIHGGGLAFGSGAAYNGSVLAARHGAVVCTMNYRLGWLGWLGFAEDGDGATGNWGLLDQQAALRWVRREAAAFGGDDKSVTIFGQSAGAGSVMMHLVAPQRRGLFDRAISESGAVGDWSRAFSLGKTAAAARKLGCEADATRKCMGARTAADVLAAQGDAPTPGIQDAQVAATVDGATLPRSVLELLRTGKGARVPFLLGGNTNDATLFVYGYPDYANMSASDYRARVNTSLYLDGRAPPAGQLERLLALYPPSDSAELNQARVSVYMSDALFLCPTKAVAAAAAAAGSPVYLFRYDHRWADPACYDIYFTPEFGVTHTAEARPARAEHPQPLDPCAPVLAAQPAQGGIEQLLASRSGLVRLRPADLPLRQAAPPGALLVQLDGGRLRELHRRAVDEPRP